LLKIKICEEKAIFLVKKLKKKSPSKLNLKEKGGGIFLFLWGKKLLKVAADFCH